MVQSKVRSSETNAARQADQCDRPLADQVNSPSKSTQTPHSNAQCQTVSSDPASDGDDAESLAKVLGVADRDFAQGLVGHLLASARRTNKLDLEQLLFTLAVIKGKEPKRELDVMLLAQMSAIHRAIMHASGVLAQAENVLEVDTLTRTVTQLARTYTAQYDAFNRHQGGRGPKSGGAERLDCQGWSSHRWPRDAGRPCDCA
jgi:hypothetical protein